MAKLPRWELGATFSTEKAIGKANNSIQIFIPNIWDQTSQTLSPKSTTYLFYNICEGGILWTITYMIKSLELSYFVSYPSLISMWMNIKCKHSGYQGHFEFFIDLKTKNFYICTTFFFKHEMRLSQKEFLFILDINLYKFSPIQ